MLSWMTSSWSRLQIRRMKWMVDFIRILDRKEVVAANETRLETNAYEYNEIMFNNFVKTPSSFRRCIVQECGLQNSTSRLDKLVGKRMCVSWKKRALIGDFNGFDGNFQKKNSIYISPQTMCWELKCI